MTSLCFSVSIRCSIRPSELKFLQHPSITSCTQFILANSSSSPSPPRSVPTMIFQALRCRLPLLSGLMARTYINTTTSHISRSSFSTLLQNSIRPQTHSPVPQSTLSKPSQIRGMKTRSSVKRLCESCKVRCPTTPAIPLNEKEG